MPFKDLQINNKLNTESSNKYPNIHHSLPINEEVTLLIQFESYFENISRVILFIIRFDILNSLGFLKKLVDSAKFVPPNNSSLKLYFYSQNKNILKIY